MKHWHKLSIASPATLAAATVVLAGIAVGDVPSHTESDDAGELPDTAQPVSETTAAVYGEIAVHEDVDLYRVCVGPDGLGASTVNEATTIDTQLFVFAGDGTALAHNDDGGEHRQSTVTLGPGAAPAGEYLVGIGTYDNGPRNAAGDPLFPDSMRDQVEALDQDDPVLAGWDHRGASAGAYRIDLSGTADCTAGPATVDVDVHPEDDTNQVSLRSKGRTVFALLGSASFDPTTVDPATVAAGPNGASLTKSPNFEDVDGDGVVDLVGQVGTADLGLDADDTELCVRAAIDSSGEVGGCDTIRTTGTGRGRSGADR